MVASLLRGMPMPVSDTVTATLRPASTCRADTRIWPRRVNLEALPSRLFRIWWAPYGWGPHQSGSNLEGLTRAHD